MTQQEAQKIVERVQKKIDKYLEARRIAEEAFYLMTRRADWSEIARLLELNEDSNFGDWTC